MGQFSEELLPPELRATAAELERARPSLTVPDLDRIKLDAKSRAARKVRPTGRGFLRSRMAGFMLAGCLLLGGGGAIAASGGNPAGAGSSSGSSAKKAYCPESSQAGSSKPKGTDGGCGNPKNKND